MVHDRANWRVKTRRAALALTVAALPFAYLSCSALQAQSVMRSPNLNIQARIPTINPTVVPRIDPNIAGRMTPNLRTYPACSYAYRNSDGECSSKPVLSTDGGGTAGTGGSVGQEQGQEQKQRSAADCRADSTRPAYYQRPERRRDRQLAVRHPNRRAGAASRLGASAI